MGEYSYLESKNLKTKREISIKIHEIDAYMRTLNTIDPHIRREYKKRDDLIKTNREKLTNLRVKLAKLVSDNADRKTRWIQKMTQMMGMTNDNFKEFFEDMGCEGRITFGPLPLNQQTANFRNYNTCQKYDTDDYANYGIIIWVSSREGAPMNMLTGSTQSGGEKSVSTMLFLLSMQPISKSPFRLIDEINQGMDNRNERKIFETLVNAANRSRTQYFLITPKLLQDLDYGDNLTIQCVYNGKHYGYKSDKVAQGGSRVLAKHHRVNHEEFMNGYERRKNPANQVNSQASQENMPLAPVFMQPPPRSGRRSRAP